MSIEEELKKENIIQEVRKYFMGATIEPNMEETKKDLIKRCEEIGIDFSELEENCKSEIPQKRTYSELIADTQIDGIERGLSVVFETLLRGEEPNTRELDDGSGKQSYSRGFSKKHRYMCRMDILRALCISLKNDTNGYELTGTDLKSFLSQKRINSNLQITKEQLDYIHSLDLSNLENFISNIDISLLPKQMIQSTDIWEAMDKRGGKENSLYEVQNKNAYRIYINTPQNSNGTDEFLTDYIKMCISKKMPFAMKGSQDKGKESKDNTVLYISEENLLDYIQILDELSILHPDTIKCFGEPPLLTQGLSNNGKNTLESWFGFADLGQDGNGGTYNERTKYSALNAFIATLYSTMPYKTKVRIQEHGFSLKALSSLAKFEPSYNEQELIGKRKRNAIFPKGIEDSENGLRSPLCSDGRLRINNSKMALELISLCRGELAQIVKHPEKKQIMFEKFKEYYVLVENYTKYNSPKNALSMQYTFEDYRNLPTTISMNLYQQYQQYQQELMNGESQQERTNKKVKSFLQEFQEFFREDKILVSGIEATEIRTNIEQMNKQTSLIKEQFRDKEKQQDQVEQ
mgnify:FL=1